MPERLSAAVRERFDAPRYALAAGQPGSQSLGSSGARAAGSLVQIHLWYGQSIRARFRAYGDPATLAAADWACEQVDGRPLPCDAPSVPECARALGLPGQRMHAASHAVAALRDALAKLAGREPSLM